MNEETKDLLQLIREKEQDIRDHLNNLGKKGFDWRFRDDPVRTKNLEKIAGLFLISFFYIAATLWYGNITYLLLMVLLSGSAGSILSHAFKLGKQPLHADENDKTREQPLGIRALISEWKVFIAQPIIGVTAALILFLIFEAGLLQIGGMRETGPEVYGLIAFLAGFSEAYFIGILEKVGGRTDSSLH